MRCIAVFSIMCLVLFGWSASSVAQGVDDLDTETTIHAASRIGEKSADVAAFVTVITAEQIEKTTARNLAEVLMVLGGLQVSDTTGAHRDYSIDFRGFGSMAHQNLLMLVDDRAVSLPDSTTPDWGLVPIERIERIEIVRGGSGNVIHGDNAVAGVVNVITKTGGKLGGRTDFTYGSYNTKKTWASGGSAEGRYAYELSTGYYESDGFRDNSDTIAQDYGISFRSNSNQRAQTYLTFGYHGDETGNPGSLSSSDFAAGRDRTDTLNPRDFTQLDDYYVQGGLDWAILSNDAFKIDASYRNRSARYYHRFDDDASRDGWEDTNIDIDGYTISPQLVFSEDFEGVSNRVSIGYDLVQLRRRSEFTFEDSSVTPTSGQFPTESERQNSSLFFYDRLMVGSKWALAGGYRLERETYRFDPANLGQRVYDEESLTCSVSYYFGANASIYGGYTRGFRFPTLDEIYDTPTQTVDETLQPYTFDDYEIGVSTVIGKRMGFKANVFRITTNDEIFADATTGGYRNMDWDTLRQGFEMSMDWRYQGLRFGAGYTYTETKFESGPNEGKEVPNVAKNRAFANVSITTEKGLLISFDGTYVGGRFADGDWTNSAAVVDDYFLFNAKIQYSWRRVALYLDFNNIFNAKYDSYASIDSLGQVGYYPAGEFSLFAGVKFNLSRS